MKLKCGCYTDAERYNEKHDAYYCLKCNQWLEDGCADKKCDYCKNRPKKPSDVKKAELKEVKKNVRT